MGVKSSLPINLQRQDNDNTECSSVIHLVEECPRCHEQLIGCDCDPDAIDGSEPEVEGESKPN